MDNRTETIEELEKKLAQASKRLKAACKALEPKHKGGEWKKYHAAHAEQMLAERELAAAKNEEYAVPLEFPCASDVRAPLPYLLENDSMVFDRGWPKENVEFIRQFVTKERVSQVVHRAAAALGNEPEAEVASTIAGDLEQRLELIESRVSELPQLLGAKQPDGWTV